MAELIQPAIRELEPKLFVHWKAPVEPLLDDLTLLPDEMTIDHDFPLLLPNNPFCKFPVQFL